ncbi:hypothetical protein ACFL6I_05995 [candidate division KSB1 bacterium]
MEERKFYIIRIKAPQKTPDLSESGDEEVEYNTAEFALENSSLIASNISNMVADIIGSRGEYLDWVELDLEEIFAEEWVIFDDECLEELRIQDFGLEEIDIHIEESPNVWVKMNEEWQISTEN